MITAPCKDCKDRFVECHVTCEKYKLFRQELNEMKAEVAKQKNLEFNLNDRSRMGISKMMHTKQS